MALKNDYLIPIGVLKRTRKYLAGHLSMKKVLAELFNWLNVPFADPCCEGRAESTPVRFNRELNRLEVWGVEEGAWIDINSIDAVTTTTTTVA